MNILIPHSWLKEYLETKASPKKIAECLSLCGASVEKVNKIAKDYVYDIEVTTNRVDMMSVLGIAREAAAILPQFGIAARLKKDPYKQASTGKHQLVSKSPKLKLKIQDPKLCPRFTANLIKNIKIKPSPQAIQQKLIKAGLRPINNIVDITNLLMKELGQPFHAFDWNKIKGQTMILRTSKKGETITTLDGQTHKLAGGDIVIEDGAKRLIDLCGIMGGSNSHVSNKTKDILLFVQTYDPIRIRQTSMTLGKRSEAAALFEKSPDPEMVLPAILKGIQLIKRYANGQPDTKIIDLYPKPYKLKKVPVSLQLIKQYLGVDVKSKEVIKILGSLGLKAKLGAKRQMLEAEIPSWRAKDVSIPEDLIEEVARIYGYHNLPSAMPPFYQVPEKDAHIFDWESKVKNSLACWGLTETISYSMYSQEELENTELRIKDHLKIKNPLTSDWVYLRTSLLPSLLSVVKKNQNYKTKIDIFELANVYLPSKNSLPQERLTLSLALTENRFLQLKGICEAIFNQLGIKPDFKVQDVKKDSFWVKGKSCLIKSGKLILGIMGEIEPRVLKNFGIDQKVVGVELDFSKISFLGTKKKSFTPILKYPPILEDLTFSLLKKVPYLTLVQAMKRVSPKLVKVELKDLFENNLTFSLTYQDPKKNLTDIEVGKIRKKIVSLIQARGWAKLKGKVTG